MMLQELILVPVKVFLNQCMLRMINYYQMAQSCLH
jgi:hypothetical protein